MTRITLPWPSSRISSNAMARGVTKRARLAKAAVVKSHRVAAGWAAKAVTAPILPATGDIRVRVTFNPPSRRIDRQNMPALVKAYVEGIASAWGVNDSRFLPEYVYGDPVRGGLVTVELLAP